MGDVGRCSVVQSEPTRRSGQQQTNGCPADYRWENVKRVLVVPARGGTSFPGGEAHEDGDRFTRRDSGSVASTSMPANMITPCLLIACFSG